MECRKSRSKGTKFQEKLCDNENYKNQERRDGRSKIRQANLGKLDRESSISRDIQKNEVKRGPGHQNSR